MIQLWNHLRTTDTKHNPTNINIGGIKKKRSFDETASDLYELLLEYI